jgi:uncharacterized membrane protein
MHSQSLLQNISKLQTRQPDPKVRKGHLRTVCCVRRCLETFGNRDPSPRWTFFVPAPLASLQRRNSRLCAQTVVFISHARFRDPISKSCKALVWSSVGHTMKRSMPLILMLVIIWGGICPAESRAAKDAVVHVALFYSPTCFHCTKLENEILPRLTEKYGKKLVIVHVNVIGAAGSRIYEAAIERLKVPEERIRIPSVIVGETLLVGTVEIPEKLPGLIDAALPKGGLGWPDLPGLQEQYAKQRLIHPENLTVLQRMSYKFKQDPLANGIAVLVLAFMLGSLMASALIVLSDVKAPRIVTLLSGWMIPLLAMIGLVVAGYLSYVEVSETSAVCGPVGNCNAVQSSPYAKLFGILPVAFMGMAGYLAIIAVWFFQQVGPASFRRPFRLALWGLGLFSVSFSSYLTFLEPFVIGATCALCLASAMIVTMILWASVLPAHEALREARQSR